MSRISSSLPSLSHGTNGIFFQIKFNRLWHRIGFHFICAQKFQLWNELDVSQFREDAPTMKQIIFCEFFVSLGSSRKRCQRGTRLNDKHHCRVSPVCRTPKKRFLITIRVNLLNSLHRIDNANAISHVELSKWQLAVGCAVVIIFISNCVSHDIRAHRRHNRTDRVHTHTFSNLSYRELVHFVAHIVCLSLPVSPLFSRKPNCSVSFDKWEK